MFIKKIFIIALAATALVFTSCKKDPVTQQQNTNNPRVIVYSMGDVEEQTILKNDSEWEALLDTFCTHAQSGEKVSFYNISSLAHFETKSMMVVPKSVSTFSTTNREKMKEWMKQMEKEGKTVNVTYDDNTGTWNGTAYATMPTSQSNNCYTGTMTCVDMPATSEDPNPINMVPALIINEDTTLILMKDGYIMICNGDMDDDTVTLCGTISTHQDLYGNYYFILDISTVSETSIIGTWSLTCLSVTDFGDGSDYLLNTTIYTPDDNESFLYQFYGNGIITKTSTTSSGTTTENSTWSLSTDGEICCSLLVDDNGCWSINWLTGNTMILSRISNGDTFYQLQFEAIQ